MGRKIDFESKRYYYSIIRAAVLVLGIMGLIIFLMEAKSLNGLIPPTASISFARSCHEPIDWSVRRIQDLTLEQIIEYLEWTNSSSCRLTHHLGGHAHVDGVDGQKAVCMDPSIRPEMAGECLVYSFGISNDWTFDEAMEQMGCRIYAFDPSMNVGNHNHSSKIHFFNLGLGDRDERWNKNPNMNWTIKSLDSIYFNLLKHEGRIIDYLKIDIENSEWLVLPQILSSGMMDRVRQLGLEIHLPEQGGLEEFRKYVAILKSMEDYGMIRFDSKYNPWSLNWNVAVDWEGYNAYEIVWFNSKLLRTSTSKLLQFKQLR